jgi:adenosylcobalamin-dependent ribonucleoside-triphosphate reductase
MYLSETFLNKYAHLNPPFGGNGLGAFIYLRTYSRWLDEQLRRETWLETCARVVEYSMSLYTGSATVDALQEEAEYMFDMMFNLKVFPAGRTLWIGGTEAAKKFGSANFNCAFVVVDTLDAFVDTFHLLMVGSGVGFRVLPRDIDKLPQFNTNIVIAHKPWHGKQKIERVEETLVYEDKDDKASILIVVGDSKGGWVRALEAYLDAMTRKDVESIVINYDSVRPQGEILKTFGGRASGHQALKNMFRAIHKVITKRTGGKLLPIDAMDIENHIASNVVVGGVRRSSQICLFSVEDSEILNAKVDMWNPKSANFGNDHRAMSNNSIFFESKPNRDQLIDIFDRISVGYEPGFINAEAARKRRPNFQGLNPCAEILLDSRGVCNLTEVNLTAFITEDGELNHEGLCQAIELATRIGLRQTNTNFDLPEWDKVQKRDRLVGVSLSGVMDFQDALGWNKESDKMLLQGDVIDANLGDDEYWHTISISEPLAVVLADMRYAANQESLLYAKEMRVAAPLLVTTIKPSGTISKMPTISAGVHKNRAPYYIRRVRITATDPLAKVMLDAGYPVYPLVVSNGPTEKELYTMKPFELAQELQKSNTWVIEFPVKTTAKDKSSDESAISQFGRYLDFQKYWTDHNTSITIEFARDEINDLIDMLLEHWDEYVGVSFMLKDTNAYPQMPEEVITEDEYNQSATKLKDITSIQIVEALKDLERDNAMSELLDADCIGGACPIR